ncbi:MAG: molybdopterin-dependent oxidoreductase, partial [Proteobacteria bacterium]|nr:molybdopterin-dependent oxidoreductase [Pseudomonadota bacterium]
VKIIFAEKKPKLGHLKDLVNSFDLLEPLFVDLDLNQIVQITGVSLECIKQVATDLTSLSPAICYGRMGVSTQAFGTVCQWLINLINILTGNFDQEGGVLFTKPAFDLIEFSAKVGSQGSFARRHSRVRGLPEFSGEFPSISLAEEILTEGKGQVRALFTVAGNPVLTVPNGKQLEKALSQLDLYVAIDIYRNETTGYAHYILPPSSPLEHSHFDLIFNALAARNTVRYSPPVLKSPKDAQEDWQILLELWSRIGSQQSLFQKGKRRIIKSLMLAIGTDRMLDLGLRTGPYRKTGLCLKKLKKVPDGIDLGALKPSLPGRLQTRDKRIELCPAPLLDAWKIFCKAPAWTHVDAKPANELLLIGRRNLKSNNSWMHNLPSLIRSKDQCFLIMSKLDGELLQVADGTNVKLTTRVGSIELPVMLSDRIMPGVVSIPHGWGHHRLHSRLGLAQQHAGVSVNDITDEQEFDRFSGNAILNGLRVHVEALNRN